MTTRSQPARTSSTTGAPGRAVRISRGMVTSLLRVSWAVSIVAVIIGSLVPASSPLITTLDRTGLSDKADHLLAYALLAFLPALSERLRIVPLAVVFGAALGIALEFAQRLTPSRTFELADMAADMAGLSLGVLLGLLGRRPLARVLERYAAAGAGTAEFTGVDSSPSSEQAQPPVLCATAAAASGVAGEHPAGSMSSELLSESELEDRFGKLTRLELMQELAQTQRLLTLRSRDGLTGAWNRAAVREILLAEIERSYRLGLAVSIVIADLDGLKTINDRYGHDAGDRALMTFCGTLSANLRAYDSIGRWGGDEFLIVLPGVVAAQAAQVADRIRLLLDGQPGQASFGVSGYGPEELSARMAKHTAGAVAVLLARSADASLYSAKQR